MIYDITGKKIYIKRQGDVKEIDNKNPHHKAALKYNHIRVQFPDESEKSLLFTNNQIKIATYRADRNRPDLPGKGWISEFVADIISLTDLADLQTVNIDGYPSALKKYNHIVVYIKRQRLDLLFTDKDIKVALDRAGKNPEDLPKVSWFTNIFD